MNRGITYAASAYLLWGLLPIFWKALQAVPPLEILSHRMVWSLGVVLPLLAFQRHWQWLRAVFQSRRTLLTFATTASLLALNWFVYIWAVTRGYLVEASLGYFINPLVSVVFGVLFLKERLHFWQAVAIAVALSGVLYMTLSYGMLPWIGLTLAGSFGCYGLLRKTAALNALEGLSLESLLLFLPALAYLLYLEWLGRAAFAHSSVSTTTLLVAAGLVTALPLLLFAAAARRIPLTLMGILQYIVPTLQFLLGVFVYGEPFGRTRLIGFCLIWFALAIYTIEGLLRGQRISRRSSAASGP